MLNKGCKITEISKIKAEVKCVKCNYITITKTKTKTVTCSSCQHRNKNPLWIN